MAYIEANWRAAQIRRHEQHDLPLYEAALRGDVRAICILEPTTSAARIRAMIATAQCFRRVQTGWIGTAFVTVVYDLRYGIWRPETMFRGPDREAVCAVCRRASVYRTAGANFCRSHSPADLRRSPTPLVASQAAG